MRIEQIRFKNLNSLAGEWRIDLTHNQYTDAGIFAITGPTGAGKTTLLDALCLALYGQTPRLKTISQLDNEIMTRHTGECFAEVTFQTIKGRFRCHWSQHRARKKPDGKLQPPRHEIVDAHTDTVLTTRIKQVAAKIIAVTGLDFDRFTRSILLPQGDFAAFLAAQPDDRAPILEQITGTEIYSRISMAVHARNRAEHERLEVLRIELAGVKVLSKEELDALKSEQEDLRRQTKQTAAEIEALNRASAWRAGIDRLTRDIAALDRQQNELDKRIAAAAPELQRLAAAGKALPLEGPHARLAETRRLQQTELTDRQNTQKQLPAKQTQLTTLAKECTDADTALATARDNKEQSEKIIRQVREWDVQLRTLEDQRRKNTRELKTLTNTQTTVRKDLAANHTAQAETARQRDQVAGFLKQNAHDHALIASLEGIRHKITASATLQQKVQAVQQQQAHARQQIRTATAALQAETTALTTAQNAVAAAGKSITAAQDALASLLQARTPAQWREEVATLTRQTLRLEQALEKTAQLTDITRQQKVIGDKLTNTSEASAQIEQQLAAAGREKDLQQQAVDDKTDKLVLLRRVDDLSAQRERLRDGQPCPLCGAEEHPYARGNVPRPDEAEKDLAAARQNLTQTEQALTALNQQQSRLETETRQAAKDRTALAQQRTQTQTELINLLTEAGLAGTVNDHTETQVQAALKDSRKCLDTGRQTLHAADIKETALRTLHEKQNTARTDLSRREKQHQNAGHVLDAAQKEHDRLQREAGELEAECLDARNAAAAAVAPYGIDRPVPEEADQVLDDLTRRKAACEEQAAAQQQLEKQTTMLQHQAARLESKQAELDLQRDKLQKDLAQQTGRIDSLSAQRQQCFGHKDPDIEAHQVAQAVQAAEARRDEHRQTINRVQNELTILQNQIDTLTSKTNARATTLATLETQFRQQLSDAGFATEAAFQQARLSAEDLHRLKTGQHALDHEAADIKARHADKLKTLTEENARQLTGQTAEAVNTALANANRQLAGLQERLGVIREKRAEQERLQASQQTKQEDLQKQQAECARWEKLHELIGSADGKKFRNFAQGLTFEQVVGHANHHLRTMSDRYLIVRAGANPLDLNIIDDYQGGEIRSTDNLSGGESFIVSLALALGLSRMAGRNVTIDSLFLDEGFGTLDEDALETALETLAGLHRDGKLIGVISHVPTLKARIPVQITIDALVAGRSRISGPGCSSPGD